MILAWILLLLGINKQADLQSLITVWGRDIVKSLGLYNARGVLQFWFIVAIAIVACIGMCL